MIVGLRAHPTWPGKVLLLTKSGELAVFTQERLERRIQLNSNQSLKQKLILLIDDYQQQQQKISIIDVRNLIIYSISDEGKVSGRQQAAQLPSIQNRKDYVTLLDAHANLILIERRLKHFHYYSFTLKAWLVAQLVRYLNYRDEAHVREFLAEHERLLERVKYKLVCLDQAAERYLLSIDVLKQVTESLPTIEFESLNHLLVVFEVNRCSSCARQIEMEITRAIPFVRSYYLARPAGLLAYNYTATNTRESLVRVLDLNRNKTRFELNLSEAKLSPVNHFTIDKRQEYLAYSDADQLVWVYRLGNQADQRTIRAGGLSQPIARLPMYSKVRRLKFAGSSEERFLCANMNDCRLYSMLLIDPLRSEHLAELEKINSKRAAQKLTRQGKVFNFFV